MMGQTDQQSGGRSIEGMQEICSREVGLDVGCS